MSPTEILEVSDKSYYADKLVQLTGKPRRYWASLPLPALRHVLRKESETKRGGGYGHRSSFAVPVLRPYQLSDLCGRGNKA